MSGLSDVSSTKCALSRYIFTKVDLLTLYLSMLFLPPIYSDWFIKSSENNTNLFPIAIAKNLQSWFSKSSTGFLKRLTPFPRKLLTKNVQNRPSIRDIFMETLIQKTIEEFIRTDGQYTTMVKIPVKKTQLHKQNTLNENSLPESSFSTTNQTPGGNTTMMSNVSIGATTSKPRTEANNQYQNETPQQRMLRKKEEQRREQEELMKKAAKESLISRNQDKERKNKELQSNVGLGNNRNNESVRASNQFQTGGMNRNTSEYGSPTYPGGGYNQPNNNYSQQYQQYGGGYEVNSPGFARQQDNNSMMTRTVESQSQSRVTNVSAFNPNDRDMNVCEKYLLNLTIL